MNKEQIYDNLIDNLPVGFSVVDLDGNIVEFNRTAEEITGYAKEEVVGKSHLQILHGDSSPDACPLLKKTFKRRQKAIATEVSLKTRGNEEITVLVTSCPLYESDGSFAGGVELFRDITQQKRSEREWRNLLSMIAHDMKNPVLTSKGFLSRLHSEKAGPIAKKQREYMEIIGDGLDRLETLVMDFLDYSKFKEKRLKLSLGEFDLSEVLRKNVEAFRFAAEGKRVRLVLDFSKSSCLVRADETMMNRVVENLLRNAIEYTEQGGTITARCLKRDKDVFVQVMNTGTGIPEEHLPYIFEAFHRVRKDLRGSGLGLAISKQMIELHKGNIRVEVTPGEETVFSFSLPQR